jgi:hypothetical protein
MLLFLLGVAFGALFAGAALVALGVHWDRQRKRRSGAITIDLTQRRHL